jgi:2-polyprenyl-3-methyl-5-hydroxy-6-metoxy-1,4-benzoquinol methylase
VARLARCPACGATARQTVEADVPDFRYGVPGRWSFVRCANCRLVCLAEPLDDPREGYPTTYSQHRPFLVAPLPAGRSLKDQLRKRFLADHGYPAAAPVLPRWLSRPLLTVPPVSVLAGYGFALFPRAVPGGKLLDVGCGNGRFLSLMSALGWVVHGIEPDPGSAEVARRLLGRPVHAELSSAPFPPETFDVITLNHVLEHVSNPTEVLSLCHCLCRRGGRIGIVVPNWRSLGHRVFGRHWYGLEPPRHVAMWERGTLVEQLERAGFHVQRARTTSAREWARSWRLSWRFRTDRGSPRVLVAAWGAVSAAAALLNADAGEEILVWAVKP